MTDVLIKRELLERAWRQLANYDTGKMIGAVLDAAPCDPGCAEICARASMCATCMADMEGLRQPEGDGLEVFGWYHSHAKVATSDKARVVQWLPECVEPLCRLSDHLRAIAELREECERVKADRASCWAEFKVMTRSCLEAEAQRDKLADILRDLVPGCKWRFMRPRIDAALAEIDHGNE